MRRGRGWRGEEEWEKGKEDKEQEKGLGGFELQSGSW